MIMKPMKMNSQDLVMNAIMKINSMRQTKKSQKVVFNTVNKLNHKLNNKINKKNNNKLIFHLKILILK
jgi:hypothetical protein